MEIKHVSLTAEEAYEVLRAHVAKVHRVPADEISPTIEISTYHQARVTFRSDERSVYLCIDKGLYHKLF